MRTRSLEICRLRSDLKGKNPPAIMKQALAQFERIGIAFSGADDVVLIDLAYRIKKGVQVFTLDTGRLHPETYQFIEEVRKHYDLNLKVLFPAPRSVEELVEKKGLFSFYEDGHHECCAIRKVEPLHRHLQTLDAWITGQRKDQSLETRGELIAVEEDQTFSTPDHRVVKFNPLANWSSAQVWDYIEAYQVPYNKLHAKGYSSIGCEPCTRPTLPHQPERAGRWWWEKANAKECGLHADNLKIRNIG